MVQTSNQRGGRKDDRRDGGFRDAPKEFQEELLGVDRVTRVTAGGRQLRFRASVIIGNGKGTVGFGTGKAGEVVVAIEKAVRDAKKNLISFPIVNGTIAHNLIANYKSAGIFIHPASKGTGIIAGGSARKIFAVSGIRDVLAKQLGANNPITNARVVLKALSQLRKDTKQKFGRTTPVEVVEETIQAPVTPVVEKKAPRKAPARKAPAKETKTTE